MYTIYIIILDNIPWFIYNLYIIKLLFGECSCQLLSWFNLSDFPILCHFVVLETDFKNTWGYLWWLPHVSHVRFGKFIFSVTISCHAQAFIIHSVFNTHGCLFSSILLKHFPPIVACRPAPCNWGDINLQPQILCLCPESDNFIL